MSENTETVTTPVIDPRNVTVEAVLEACEEEGCVIVEKKSYFAVEAPDYNKKCLYVGKAKRRMTRLDFAGFVAEDHPALVHLTEEDAKSLKLGAVRGQILPKEIHEEDTDVLDAVRCLCAEVLDSSPGFKLGKRQAKVEEIDVAAEVEIADLAEIAEEDAEEALIDETENTEEAVA